MRIVPCHPLLWPRPLLLRRVVSCVPIVPCAPACDLPVRTYDQNLQLQNIQRVGTDEPVASTAIPFDLRLARLNAQLRAAEHEARKNAEGKADHVAQPATLNQYA